MLLGRRTDVLATNRLARALLTDFDAMPAKERNYARWMFLGEQARELLADWDVQARMAVENLRLDAGRDPGDPATQALVGELTIASPEFAHWWQEHRVFQRTHGDKHFRHPVVGELTLQYETLTMPGDPHPALFVFTAPAGSQDRPPLHPPARRHQGPAVPGPAGQLVETLPMPGDPDQALFVFTAPAGSKHRQSLDLLASWTLTTSTAAATGPER